MGGRIKIPATILHMKASYAIRQHVIVRLQVSRWGADVHPVSARWNVREKRFTVFEQLWKQIVFKRIVLASWNQVEHPWLKHVRTGVNVPTVGLARFWLFDKALHASLAVGFHHAVHAGIFDR